MYQRVIAETGAGQHGVATATVAAKFGMKCTVYMGAEDVRRQALNVFRMRLLGAEVIPVQSGVSSIILVAMLVLLFRKVARRYVMQ